MAIANTSVRQGGGGLMQQMSAEVIDLYKHFENLQQVKRQVTLQEAQQRAQVMGEQINKLIADRGGTWNFLQNPEGRAVYSNAVASFTGMDLGAAQNIAEGIAKLDPSKADIYHFMFSEAVNGKAEAAEAWNYLNNAAGLTGMAFSRGTAEDQRRAKDHFQAVVDKTVEKTTGVNPDAVEQENARRAALLTQAEAQSKERSRAMAPEESTPASTLPANASLSGTLSEGILSLSGAVPPGTPGAGNEAVRQWAEAQGGTQSAPIRADEREVHAPSSVRGQAAKSDTVSARRTQEGQQAAIEGAEVRADALTAQGERYLGEIPEWMSDSDKAKYTQQQNMERSEYVNMLRSTGLNAKVVSEEAMREAGMAALKLHRVDTTRLSPEVAEATGKVLVAQDKAALEHQENGKVSAETFEKMRAAEKEFFQVQSEIDVKNMASRMSNPREAAATNKFAELVGGAKDTLDLVGSAMKDPKVRPYAEKAIEQTSKAFAADPLMQSVTKEAFLGKTQSPKKIDLAIQRETDVIRKRNLGKMETLWNTFVDAGALENPVVLRQLAPEAAKAVDELWAMSLDERRVVATEKQAAAYASQVALQQGMQDELKRAQAELTKLEGSNPEVVMGLEMVKAFGGDVLEIMKAVAQGDMKVEEMDKLMKSFPIFPAINNGMLAALSPVAGVILQKQEEVRSGFLGLGKSIETTYAPAMPMFQSTTTESSAGVKSADVEVDDGAAARLRDKYTIR